MGAVMIFIISLYRQKYAKLINHRKKNKLLIQFRDLMYSLSALISSGRSLSQGLAESVDFWKGTYDDDDFIIKELKNMTKRMREGRERDIELLKDFAERSGVEDIKDFVMVCDTCKKTGGNFSEAICRCADIIGDKISLEKDLKAMAAQKKFEGVIVGAAPFLIIFFIKLLSPEYLEPLSYTKTGRVISTVALLIAGCGWFFIERVNEIEF